ncbi:uncharacterized protein TrAFT101_010731 [Trichoderma asperellum]|uniref:Uncharacterized protein n=1 Tax=Trichoderma asperellum (strain ATCC 204424 / CBS 433.97 / NBRC 101777) TaxID=1042311 RepID=A0A2T3YTM9_TRIA4|nr:hypothetical protein M441DRAFT_51900 [Trichoderma asperellum CBS 433.97]PTB35879.1 hypothetical protein M441DRAFT_51900 [Trichoderma asperellum CBS 433.97]UKZ95923.1 hypothetical protein TrAFT101_010731 [Trichoderma asperellum]
MKISYILTFQAILGAASAAPLEGRSICLANFVGTNSEGDGGPGQAPFSYNDFGITITGGGKKFHHKMNEDADNGTFQRGIKGEKIGSKTGVKIHANWDYANNSWYGCHIKKNGHKYIGKVKSPEIHTGAVSVTEDHCTVHFPC